jgi:hypothetical protein
MPTLSNTSSLMQLLSELSGQPTMVAVSVDTFFDRLGSEAKIAKEHRSHDASSPPEVVGLDHLDTISDVTAGAVGCFLNVRSSEGVIGWFEISSFQISFANPVPH